MNSKSNRGQRQSTRLLFALTAILCVTFVLLYQMYSARRAQAVSTSIVISQVYGGGGNSGAQYTNDFVELFNRGNTTISLSGWSIQYTSATGTGNFGSATNLITPLSGSIAPGQYLLIQEASNAAVGAPLPTPDVTDTTPINMSGTAGKVALVNTTTPLGCNGGSTPCSAAALATIVDLVGYGNANFFEGSATAPTLTNTTADFRDDGGCVDTDQNLNDFSSAVPPISPDVPAPRNTSSPLKNCGGSPTPTPTPTLSIGDVTQIETDSGTTTFSFNVMLTSPAQAGGVTFTINTADGTTNPANSGSDYVAIVNGSGSIAAGGTSTTVSVTVNGDTTQEANETFFVNITNITGANAGDTQGLGTITNDDVTLTSICQVQGAGTTSPVVNQPVTTRGIVTGIRIGAGFYIQDNACDADPNTSDGVFVFTGASIPAAAVVGNRVQVGGTAQEFIPSADVNQKPVTEIAGSPTVSVLSTGNPLPSPTVITAADTQVNNLENLERFEGMRVAVLSLTVVAPTQGTISEPGATVTSNGVFYGVVTGVARPFREPGVNASDPLPPGSPANVPRFDENPERLRVDSNAEPGTTAVNVSTGAAFTNVIGELDYAFRTWTIDPEQTLTGGTNSGPTAAPTPMANEFTVASFNMERFFDTVNDPNKDDPVLTQTALDKRLNKASLIIRNVQHYPDVIGVEEMENLSTLQMVAAKVNSDAQTIDTLPNPNYVAYLVEGNDIGGIDVGFLVKESRITTVDVTQIELPGCNHISGAGCYTYTNPNTGGQELLNDRPPLVLRATIVRPPIYGGGTIAFTVIVNHLRSLSSIDDDVTVNGSGTAGGRVRAKRKAQADFLANYIQSRQTSDPNERIITVGDMNAFRVNDGYVDMIGTILGTPSPDDQTVVAGDGADLVNPDQTDLVDTLTTDQQYSYTFDGNAQTLDHVIVNTNALAMISRFVYAREDADQPVNDYADGTIPDRISDHDQPIAYFSFPVDSDSDGVLDANDNCPNTPNPDQADADGDGRGDVCDACPMDAANDADGDGVCGNVDNCPTTPNPDQGDADGDGRGDACDTCPNDPNNDQDGDGVCGNIDNCPTTPNPSQADADGDGRGDPCDSCPLDAANDIDNDGVCGNVDNCPTVYNPDQLDTNHDSIGDACTGYQFPAGGAFVIGNNVNLTGGSTVYFWGAQWSQNNPTSGGSASNSFKGFEGGNTSPTCGGTWTSSPGNSSNPPATVPQYMAVIVAGSIQKNGSVLSGDIRKIVIVQTNPGYGPSAGQPGTGQVVAVICGNSTHAAALRLPGDQFMFAGIQTFDWLGLPRRMTTEIGD